MVMVFIDTFFKHYRRVLIPKGRYKGQKLIKEVSTNTRARTPRTIAHVPEMTFMKYSTAMMAAIVIRMILSVFPMFFFIVFFI